MLIKELKSCLVVFVFEVNVGTAANEKLDDSSAAPIAGTHQSCPFIAIDILSVDVACIFLKKKPH